MNSRAKVIVACALVMLWLVPVTATAAQSSIAVDVRELLDGFIGVEYETARTRDVSHTFGGMYVSRTAGTLSHTGLNATVGMRKYLDGQVHHGPHVGGALTGSMLRMKDGSETGSLFGLGVRGTAGYKVVADGGFTFDLSGSLLMPVYSRVSWEGETETSFQSSLGTGWNFFVGYAW